MKFHTKMSQKPHWNTRVSVTLTAAALALMGVSLANAAETVNATQIGQRVDNARVESREITAPVEIQSSPILYKLPSGVSIEDAQKMKAANDSLPVRKPDLQERLSENVVGALFQSGKADLLPTAKKYLSDESAKYRNLRGLKISVIGHTDNQQLSYRAKQLFKNNQGLSEARAIAVATFLASELGLPRDAIAVEGKGDTVPIGSNLTSDGMAKNRRVEINIWYTADSLEAMPAQEAKPLPPCAQVFQPNTLPFRVTVDGEDIASAVVSEADRQRCTDVALEKENIQIKYDGLAAKPALNIWTKENYIKRGQTANFAAWSNFPFWIKSAEVRVFEKGQPSDGKPRATIPLTWNDGARWPVPVNGNEEFTYVLRVYDSEGRFDETAPKPLNIGTGEFSPSDLSSSTREALTGWGESSLRISNIPINGGTITVSGNKVRPGSTVLVQNIPTPVDIHGAFVTRQILPVGPSSVEVKISSPDGLQNMFRRNLSIPDNDWFYIAIGDLTAGHNKVSGPAALVTADSQHYENKTYIDGRGAFYLKGKIKGEWLLTAAADTGEQPFEDLFTNFSSKDPRYLLRNIDPDAYYPVYGDDSTTVDDAPTQGKFYVRLEKGDSHVMWGNFQTQWTGSELVQYSRGLYGARAQYKSERMTGFGDRRTQAEVFVADPGTLDSREEFRGTGGSLYYLRHLDITRGSERVWIEVRDKDSGIVLERKLLTPAEDYEVNYLQGRILLSQPLSSTVSSSSLVYTTGLNGNPQYLVTTYEYVPGLTEINSLSTGLHATHWINDALQIGVTHYRQGEASNEQTLDEVEATVRLAAGTSIKAEVAKSTGSGSSSLSSIDGGYGFSSTSASTTESAIASRVEANVDLAEITDGHQKGKISAYVQDKDRGYSGPGQVAYNSEAISQAGIKGSVEVGVNSSVYFKADNRNSDSQDYEDAELGFRHKLNSEWGVAVGARYENRETHTANASTTLSEQGQRTDVTVRADYSPDKVDGKAGEKADWNAYAYAQGTIERTEERDENDRLGLGGSWRINDRVKLNAEASDGSLGVGGLLGIDYQVSDRSNAYLNYEIETENPDATYRGRYTSWVSGSDYRVNDEMRLYGQLRSTSGAGSQSLTNAFGVDLAPNNRWTYGLKLELGRVSDANSGDLRRKAAGFSVAYKEDGTKYAGSLEFRRDETDGASYRNTWLLRNTYERQVTPAWRLLGKFNLSQSDNTNGAFYDGNYHEVVLGAAYRPIDNDRWNTLIKYTNYYNVPSAGQLVASGSVADYAQKSNVFSIDTVWDTKPWLSLGFKYGLRIGKLRSNKDSGDWFSSKADLTVLRADWHWTREWDAIAELRNLRAKEAKDAKSGFLLAIYRHVNKNVKVGVGYNFTNYSDDLTNLSYRSRGWFINVIGSM